LRYVPLLEAVEVLGTVDVVDVVVGVEVVGVEVVEVDVVVVVDVVVDVVLVAVVLEVVRVVGRRVRVVD